ncbi:uncharacterized protein RJT20DRAFT_127404 [Scheffersomyces xylosifermentans]|uniref:uncharacterized protein n=1 Tax=Scheffersomyces xylosifermentans TaxID=1304137 RepID=UPI00315CF08F
MSDDEFYSEESYEFEFEEEEEEVASNDVQDVEEEEDLGIENKYYAAKGLKYDDPEQAIKELNALVNNTEDNEVNNEWRFKACKQLIKIYFNSQKFEAAIEYLKALIRILPKVNKNYAEESMTKIVTNYSIAGDPAFVNELYETVLSYLQQTGTSAGTNDRLYLKITLSKLGYYLEDRKYDECPALITAINEKLTTVSDATNKSFALEAIASEIEYETHKKNVNLSRLNSLYRKSLRITTAVTHPKILGTIRECGAKVQFYRGEYEKARVEFYECFKNFDEAGSSKKKRILKYLTLCSLLTENEFNPFESQETQTYSQLAEFSDLLLLMQSYDEMDLKGFRKVIERIRTSNSDLSSDDIFLHAQEHILVNLKSKIVIHYLAAFKTIRFDYIRDTIEMTQEDLEALLLKLINTGKISNIKLDFVNEYIESSDKSNQVFPLTLRSEDIYYNLKAIESIRLDSSHPKFTSEDSGGDNMEIDNDRDLPVRAAFTFGEADDQSKESILSTLLFSSEKQQSDPDWFRLIDSWFRYMVSAIPPAAKSELSQKDQIFLEQRAEKAQIAVTGATARPGSVVEADVANQNTNAGILNSTLNPDAHGEETDGYDYNETIHKQDLLTSWYKEIQKYYHTIANK